GVDGALTRVLRHLNVVVLVDPLACIYVTVVDLAGHCPARVGVGERVVVAVGKPVGVGRIRFGRVGYGVPRVELGCVRVVPAGQHVAATRGRLGPAGLIAEVPQHSCSANNFAVWVERSRSGQRRSGRGELSNDVCVQISPGERVRATDPYAEERTSGATRVGRSAVGGEIIAQTRIRKASFEGTAEAVIGVISVCRPVRAVLGDDLAEGVGEGVLGNRSPGNLRTKGTAFGVGIRGAVRFGQ